MVLRILGSSFYNIFQHNYDIFWRHYVSIELELAANLSEQRAIEELALAESLEKETFDMSQDDNTSWALRIIKGKDHSLKLVDWCRKSEQSISHIASTIKSFLKF